MLFAPLLRPSKALGRANLPHHSPKNASTRWAEARFDSRTSSRSSRNQWRCDDSASEYPGFPTHPHILHGPMMRRIRLWATGCAHPHMLHANSSQHKCRHRSHLSRHHHWLTRRSINRRSGKKSKICLTGRWILKSASLSYQVDFSILIRSIETGDRVRRLDFCKKMSDATKKSRSPHSHKNFSTRFGWALYDD